VHLDGLTGRHQLVAHAPELGPLLDELHERGLLDDDPGPSATLSRTRRERHAADLAARALATGTTEGALRLQARRSRATVVVRGNDRAAAHVALGLAAAGVGTVALHGPDRRTTLADLTPGGPFEPNVSWRDELSDAIRRQGAHPTSLGTRTRRPAVVVLCSAADVDLPWTDPELADDLLADSVPHLAVAVAGAAARVGPLVLPGRSACLWCLDRRQVDADPAWPALADQIRLGHPQARAHSGVLATVAGAFAVAQALQVLDADPRTDPGTTPATLDAVVEFREPDALGVRLPVARHPLCGCGWDAQRDTMAG
jgi:hypothetical protein